MFFSIRGKVISKDNRFVVIESSGIGYEVLVAKPDSFVIGDETFLYLHHEIKEDNEFLVGFNTLDEKNCFRLLLHVNGIGPKTALNILAKVEFNDLLIAISNNDVDFIESIPGINNKTASQILLDLKEYISKKSKENSVQYNEARQFLKGLKFKAKDIDQVLPKIYIPNATTDQLVKEALRRLDHVKNCR